MIFHMRDQLKGCRKYRVGSYHIIYQIVRKQLVIMILDVGDRKDIYR